MFSSSSPSKIPLRVVVKSSAGTATTSSRAQWTSVASPSASGRVSLKSCIPRPVRATRAPSTPVPKGKKSICTPTAITQYGLLTPPPTPTQATRIFTLLSKASSQKPRAASVTPTPTCKTVAVTPPQKSTRPPSAKTATSPSTPRKVLNRVSVSPPPPIPSTPSRKPRAVTPPTPTSSRRTVAATKARTFSFATPSTPIKRAQASIPTQKISTPLIVTLPTLLNPVLKVATPPASDSGSEDSSIFDADLLSIASSETSLFDETCPFSDKDTEEDSEEESPFSFSASGDEDPFATQTVGGEAYDEAMRDFLEVTQSIREKNEKLLLRIRNILKREEDPEVAARPRQLYSIDE